MFRKAILLAALSVPAVAMAAPVSGPAYVMKAGASDLYEIQSSRLVMNSHNADVARFARKMVTDHTNSTAEVKAAAMRARVRVGAPRLEPMQARMIAELRRTPAARRDALYISQQKKAHQMALALHRGYADDGRVAPLKMTAAKIAPVVRSHLDMLNGMRM